MLLLQYKGLFTAGAVLLVGCDGLRLQEITQLVRQVLTRFSKVWMGFRDEKKCSFVLGKDALFLHVFPLDPPTRL